MNLVYLRLVHGFIITTKFSLKCDSLAVRQLKLRFDQIVIVTEIEAWASNFNP